MRLSRRTKDLGALGLCVVGVAVCSSIGGYFWIAATLFLAGAILGGLRCHYGGTLDALDMVIEQERQRISAAQEERQRAIEQIEERAQWQRTVVHQRKWRGWS